MNDVVLLREFVREGSQRAFADLVRRYTPLVHSAALRQLRDPAAAEDATQAVFICLANKAHQVREGAVLSAWLMTATRYYCANTRKMQARRRAHEKEAARRAGVPESPPLSSAVWEQVAPALDAALAKLGHRIRSAMLLRYFEGMSVKQVAQRLGLSEVAARQRLSRGVDQLRTLLAREGVETIASFDLAALLGVKAVTAPPAGLAETIVSAASHASSQTAAAIGGGKGLVTVMATAKAKLAAALVAAALLTGGGAVVAHQYHLGADSRVVPLAITQSGAPAKTIGIEAVVYSGAVVEPDGKPVAGAQVYLASEQMPISAYTGVMYGGDQSVSTKTADDGTFSFPPGRQCKAIVVRSAEGFAMIDPKALASHHQISLAPWGKLEVTVRNGSRVLPQTGVVLGNALEGQMEMAVYLQNNGKTDASGRAFFPQVVPGSTWIARQLPSPKGQGTMYTHSTSVMVAPGQTAQVTIGGMGRLLTGSVAADGHPDLPIFTGLMTLLPKDSPVPADANHNTPGVPYSFTFWTATDGSFRVGDVPAGRYRLHIQANSHDPGSRYSEVIADGETEVTVGAVSSGNEGQIQDLGQIGATFHRRFKPGDAAPEFAAARPSGAPVRVADYRGKYLLLFAPRPRNGMDNWIANELAAVWDEFGDDERFGMVELWGGAGEPPASSAQAPWPHARLTEPFRRPLPREYAAPMPLFLIAPDGKLIAKNLDARSALVMLVQHLGRRRAGIGNVVVNVEHHAPDIATPAFAFNTVPPLTSGDLSQKATFSIVDGAVPTTGWGGLSALNDGLGPANEDQPSANFFFESGVLEGRLKADFGRTLLVAKVNTYSWHKSNRCAQVYKLYGSDGTSPDFEPAPKVGVDPARRGWTLLAIVDTRQADGSIGGQDAVSISFPDGKIAHCRYLLFVTFSTEADDPWGNTFFSEIGISAR